MENILIVDTETTGLEPTKGATVIEIGAILYNLKHKAILQNFSTLLPCSSNPVEDINHINPEATQCKMPLDYISQVLRGMLNAADCIVAHNAEFDKKFIRTMAIGNDFMQKPWVCTKKDFKWPVQLFRNRLQDVCEAMRVEYVDAHRALADCNFLAQCFSKVENLEQRFAWLGKNVFENANCFV